MRNQLILVDETKRDKLLKYIPLGYIRESLEDGFKREVSGPDQRIGAAEVYRALKYLEGRVSNIYHDMFSHKLVMKVDKINDFIYWKYLISIRNATIDILVTEDTFDSLEIHTPKMFMADFGKRLNKGNIRIDRFNEIAKKHKPVIPKDLPKGLLLNKFMKNTRGASNIDIANALHNIKRSRLNREGTARLMFKVFTMPDTSWLIIDVSLRLNDMAFLLVSKEMPFNEERNPEDFYMNLITEMEASIRNWNFIVEGRKKSKVKVREGAKFRKTGRR